ncbi:MAG: hypothetical protein KJN72_12180 [Woeseia sp.]|nr:hypothetical protein [Woeseia sp.]
MVAPTSLAYAEWRLSGGASNTDPLRSLGGVMSSERILHQTAAAATNVTGVVMDDAIGNPVGNGTLAYVNSTGALTWAALGESAGTAVIPAENGRYALRSSGGGWLFVTVTFASLPGSDQTDNDITIADIANELWDDIAKVESFNGDVEHRTVYLYNAHPSGTMFGPKFWLTQPNGADSAYLGIDSAGVGDGAATGVAAECIERPVTNAISALSWTTANGGRVTVTSIAHGRGVGDDVELIGNTPVAYNGVFPVELVLSADQFTFLLSTDPGTATGFGNIGSRQVIEDATWSASVVTVDLTAHGFSTNDYIRHADNTPSGYDGLHQITKINDDSYSYALVSDPGTLTTPGTAARVSETGLPLSVIFSQPSNSGNGVSAPDNLDFGEAIAVHYRRTVPAVTTVATATDKLIRHAQINV